MQCYVMVHRLKQGSALGLLSKGLFYIRAMEPAIFASINKHTDVLSMRLYKVFAST